MKLSIRQSVELFHLILLSMLGKRLDKQLYALKGGCNLRFFFGSPRYSEDMDLDLGDMPAHGLRDKVNAILESLPFRQVLAASGLAIEHITEHKQTETTQRWKLGLHVPATAAPVPTKVEFSRRGLRQTAVLESVAPALLHAYRITPFMTMHYPGETALHQKIEALATRSVTQARDVFDFHLLYSDARMRALRGHVDASLLPLATQNAISLSYDDFKGQVLAYLAAEDQAMYDSPAAWDTMQLRVVEGLEQLHESD